MPMRNITPDQMCKAQSKSTGVRCTQIAMTGLNVCVKHGGATKLAKAKSAKAKTEIEVRKHGFGHPIPSSDPESNPIYAFELDFRRTVSNIRYCQEQLELLSAEQMIWGKTKEESGDGVGQFGGTTETFESKTNIWMEVQFRERKHLLDLQKVWIGAKLDVAKLSMMQSQVAQLDQVITKTLVALGLDPNDPNVRRVVRENLMKITRND